MSAPTPAAGEYYYDLPTDLIAQDPAPRRSDSRLLRVDLATGDLQEFGFRQLPDLLQPGDLLILNDSRVIPARLWTRRLDTSGRVELLLVRPVTEAGTWLAMARPTRRLRPGTHLVLTDPAGTRPDGPVLNVSALGGDGFVEVETLKPAGAQAVMDLAEVAEKWGEVPLPPYIKRDVTDPLLTERRHRDRTRYQTIYADEAGSVAAPTAGLHFDAQVLADLAARDISTARITLHVGPGTFRPPSPSQFSSQRLHGEHFHFPAATDALVQRTRQNGGRVIAVGTTSLRVLETVHRLREEKLESGSSSEQGRTDHEFHWPDSGTSPLPVFVGRARRQAAGWDILGMTRLFIKPPDPVQAAEGLLTNFHLPGSSLLMLVAALLPEPLWRQAYEHAVRQEYRFYSYGDAMLILPADKRSRVES